MRTYEQHGSASNFLEETARIAGAGSVYCVAIKEY